jgi:hypothetical protein
MILASMATMTKKTKIAYPIPKSMLAKLIPTLKCGRELIENMISFHPLQKRIA